MGHEVYRLPGTRPTWEQSVVAAVLAAGPGAAASHRSAAALLGMPGFPRAGTPEVTTPRRRQHRPHASRVHRSRDLCDEHLTVVDGIRTTGAARTLLDLAGVVHPERLERVLDNCLSAKTAALPEVQALLAAVGRRGRPGTALLRRLLADRTDGYVPPASELEARFLQVVRSAGLPAPVRQFSAGDDGGWVGRVDFAYPRLELLIEVDGRRYHTAKLDLEADRSRDNRLMAAGWRVLRISWNQLASRPDEVVALLRRSGITNGRPDDVERTQFAGQSAGQFAEHAADAKRAHPDGWAR